MVSEQILYPPHSPYISVFSLDTAGQERFKSIASSYYRGTNGK